MRDRVARDPDYAHVAIRPRWDSFANFFADMGEQPEGKTLDRRDSFGGYNLENCRWATPLEQARNRTNNVKYEFQGASRTLTEIADLIGMAHKTLFSRINQYGWTLSKALSIPVNAAKRNGNAVFLSWRDRIDT